MGRNPIHHKRPGYIRVRMHRERKKMQQMLQQQQSVQENYNNISSDSTSASTSSSELNDKATSNEPSLEEKLRDWANTYPIPKRAVDSLLAILRSCGIDSLPKNHRTLLKTPLDIQITETAGGSIWYDGLEKSLVRLFTNLDRDTSVSLNFNIDGLPLYKSSKISFWPILASIHGINSHQTMNVSPIKHGKISLFQSYHTFHR